MALANSIQILAHNLIAGTSVKLVIKSAVPFSKETKFANCVVRQNNPNGPSIYGGREITLFRTETTGEPNELVQKMIMVTEHAQYGSVNIEDAIFYSN